MEVWEVILLQLVVCDLHSLTSLGLSYSFGKPLPILTNLLGHLYSIFYELVALHWIRN